MGQARMDGQVISTEAGWDLIARALDEERPLIDTEDFRRRVESDEAANLWLGERSAVFTAIVDYPTRGERVLEVGPAGGDLEEIIAAFPVFDAVAREAGCTQAHLSAGRAGIARVFRKFGFEDYAHVSRKLY